MRPLPLLDRGRGNQRRRERTARNLERRGEAPPAVRRPPPGADGGVDHISGLPDGVLAEIISLLPTEDGARTQILASRWRHLWHSAPLNLDLRLSNRPHLAGIVSHILSSHLAPARRFCVQASIPQARLPLDAWLRSPTLDNLQELELYQYQELPPAPIFRFAPTLRILNIGAFLLPDDAIAQGLQFRQLKQLGINDVTISECALRSLVGGCPALESLLIKGCIGFCCLRISSLTLRGIAVDNYSNQRSDVQLNDLTIDNAPCLERLLLHFRSCVNVSVVAAPKLEAIGFLSDHSYMSSQDQLNRLVLGSTIIQGLRVDKLAMVVRTIKILGVQMRALSLDTVIGLMSCFPCLEKLYIRASKSESNNSWRPKHQNLIKCLDTSLKTIELKSYRGIKSQVNFVTFFVLNARVLELMTLEVSGHSSEVFLAEQRMKLQLENRASRGAQFNFTTDRNVPVSWNMKHIRDLGIDPFV